MRSTKIVVDVLRRANPGATVNEDRVRNAIRREIVAPRSFAGRLAWSAEDIRTLARALNLNEPALDEQSVPAVPAI
jgi:hypothetical protein